MTFSALHKSYSQEPSKSWARPCIAGIEAQRSLDNTMGVLTFGDRLPSALGVL